MNNEELQKKILGTIEDKCIEPKSSRYFLLKNIILWTVLAVLVILTAISGALLMFHVVNGGYFQGNMMLVGRIVINLALIALVVHYLQSMKCAYRKSVLHWVILGAVMVSVGGVLIFASRIHHHVDQSLGKMHPALSVEMKAQYHWSQPEEFRLLGSIVRKVDVKLYELRDFEGETWIVDTSRSIEPTQRVFDKMKRIRTVGFVQNGVFVSCLGSPWMSKGMMKKPQESPNDYRPETQESLDEKSMFVEPRLLERFRERNLELLRSNKCQ